MFISIRELQHNNNLFNMSSRFENYIDYIRTFDGLNADRPVCFCFGDACDKIKNGGSTVAALEELRINLHLSVFMFYEYDDIWTKMIGMWRNKPNGIETENMILEETYFAYSFITARVNKSRDIMRKVVVNKVSKIRAR